MKTTVPQAYQTVRERFPHTTVEIGYWGVEIAPLSKVAEAQLGYSVLPDGVKGDTSGWKKSWLVIGRETLGGDPVFVDTSKPGLPVFTSAHGVGSWNPILIAPSIEVFFEVLVSVAALAKGRENPGDLGENPISKNEARQFRKLLSARLGQQIPVFWSDMFEK